VDLRDETNGFKIREQTIAKVPYLLVVGDKEIESGNVDDRTRKGEDLGVMIQDQVLELFEKESKNKGRSTDTSE